MKSNSYPVIQAQRPIDRNPELIAIDDAVKGIINDASERPRQFQSLADQAMDARHCLFEAMEGIGEAVEKFEPKMNAYARGLRAFKTGTVFELNGMLNAFKDVRKFFLDPSHLEEVKRLQEFVDLCERLQGLKNSGFLDAIADTILKLSCHEISSSETGVGSSTEPKSGS